MLTTTDTVNCARDLNRAAKARKLADCYIDKLGGTPTQAACLNHEGRDALAIEAGCSVPSVATWSAVVAILEDRGEFAPWWAGYPSDADIDHLGSAGARRVPTMADRDLLDRIAADFTETVDVYRRDAEQAMADAHGDGPR